MSHALIYLALLGLLSLAAHTEASELEDQAKFDELELEIFATSGPKLTPEQTRQKIGEAIELLSKLPETDTRKAVKERLSSFYELSNTMKEDKLCGKNSLDWYKAVEKISREHNHINMVDYLGLYIPRAREYCGYMALARMGTDHHKLARQRQRANRAQQRHNLSLYDSEVDESDDD